MKVTRELAGKCLCHGEYGKVELFHFVIILSKHLILVPRVTALAWGKVGVSFSKESSLSSSSIII